MATFSAADLSSKPRHMGGHGNAVVVYGSVTPTAGTLGDVYRPVIIPAGVDVTDVDIVSYDLDSSGTPAIACKVGYSPLSPEDGPMADDDYFAPAGTTLLRNAGRTSLAFQPVRFEKPVYLIITLTASSATFASGKVTAVVKGDGVGIR